MDPAPLVTGASASPLRYAGERLDPTGQYDLRARHYGPATARFTGLDPLLDATGDPYQYAGNQPLLYTDPTGLLGCGPFADVCHKTAGLAGDVTDSITHNSLTPGANPLADKLNSVLNTRVGSVGSKTLAVFGNGISFGGIEHLDAKLSPGSECYYANLGAAYQIIGLAGNLVGAELTGAGLTRLADLALTRGAAALQRLGPINDTGAIRFFGGAASEDGTTLFRGMRGAADGTPELGSSAKTLGARPRIDIPVDEGGMVRPGTGGMSVNESPTGMPDYRRPPSFGGSGEDLNMYCISSCDVGPGLTYVPDAGGHGFLQPAWEMPFAEYQSYLQRTAHSWTEVIP